MGMYGDVYAVSSDELRGLLADPSTIGGFLNAESISSTSLEKAWHGLHYLLTGSALESEDILGFLVAGGSPVGDVDLGYGPARYLDSDEVGALDAALSRISDDDLWSRYDAETMEAEAIYPGIWDEPEEDLRDEYLMYFNALKEFIHRADRDGMCLIVTIT